jgi:hypothetical protein
LPFRRLRVGGQNRVYRTKASSENIIPNVGRHKGCGRARLPRRGGALGAARRGGGWNWLKMKISPCKAAREQYNSSDQELTEEIPVKGGALHANTDSIELALCRTFFAHEHSPSRTRMRARGGIILAPARHNSTGGQRSIHASILRDLRKFSFPFAGGAARISSLG